MPAVVALVPQDCAPSPNVSGTTLPQDGRLVTGRRPVLLMQIAVYLFTSAVCSPSSVRIFGLLARSCWPPNSLPKMAASRLLGTVPQLPLPDKQGGTASRSRSWSRSRSDRCCCHAVGRQARHADRCGADPATSAANVAPGATLGGPAAPAQKTATAAPKKRSVVIKRDANTAATAHRVRSCFACPPLPTRCRPRPLRPAAISSGAGAPGCAT